jgi:hypothetical protein
MTDMPVVPEPAQKWPTLDVDAGEYLHFLDDCDWTEDQKREFIEALWQIVIGFVDLGFRGGPIPEIEKTDSVLAPESPSVIEFNEISTNEPATQCPTRARGEK